jgi:hypothetical protein
MIPLAAFEEIIDASGTAPRIEAMLPAGVRARQLLVRTLLLGMLLALADHRPAHLTRVHQALTALGEDDQRRLGVITDWKNGPHQLTYRQAEYTFGLVAGALAKDEPDGLPSPVLQAICDDLLEASIPDQFKDASTSLAVDWTDLESFSRPPPRGTSDCADPEASWGHRKNNLLRSQRPQGHPPRRHHRQREPVLPPDAAAAAGTQPARPHRHQPASRRPRPTDRRGRPLQARTPDR